MLVLELIKNYGSTFAFILTGIGVVFNIIRRIEKARFKSELAQNERISRLEGDDQTAKISKLEGQVAELSKMVMELTRNKLSQPE